MKAWELNTGRLGVWREELPSQWAVGYMRDRILGMSPNMRARLLVPVRIRRLFSDSYFIFLCTPECEKILNIFNKKRK